MTTAPGFSLDDFLQQRWLAVAERAGDRRAALLQTIAERGAQRGFGDGVQAARFANLCLALGPGFETRPENEWALAILLNEALEPWARLHQLVAQALVHLKRRGSEGQALAQRLQHNDQLLLDRFEPEQGGRRRVPALRRSACDLEAVELRLRDTGFRQEYRRVVGQPGQWQRVAVEVPAAVRINAQHPAPERVTVLAQAEGAGAPVRVQVRTAHHAHCALGLHPAIEWQQPAAGRERWQGEAARTASWPLAVPPDTGPPRLLQTGWHLISRLQVESCGLRDEGQPLGSLALQVWAYPARQHLLTLEREGRWAFDLKAAGATADPTALKPSRIRLERDGAALAVPAWQQGFDEGLRDALGQGLQQVLQAWQHRVQEASLQAEFGLFEGRAGLTWGWREGPRGLVSPPVQRVVAEFDCKAAGELHLHGVVEFGGARARLHLRAEGLSELQATVERLQADVDLLGALQPTVLRWRWPFKLEHDALADDSAVLLAEVGPCSGALVGSLGLRPNPLVGGAWEWFVTLALEPVAARVVVHDPLLGRSEAHLALLGSTTVLDWSLG
ncbi:hypothetical protein [Pseudorhodoferax sp.]|uniref:hypothetical protein n=1 Tax=Pseudorhodoferax sp. TaxID=1993553 RepID=UPI002DD68EFD|nr:hypothetical protein [Pseudorhodoferax sp.]